VAVALAVTLAVAVALTAAEAEAFADAEPDATVRFALSGAGFASSALEQAADARETAKKATARFARPAVTFEARRSARDAAQKGHAASRS
jgi:hypothetical protein